MSVLNFFAFALVLALSTVTVYYVNDFGVKNVKPKQPEHPFQEDGVWVLNTKNFDSFVQQYDYVLAEFYAPWCGHCKKLTPEYAKAAQVLASDPKNSKIALAKVDATLNQELGQRFSVSGYPTLKFIVEGNVAEPREYTGGRTENDIVAWVLKKSGPPSVQINNKQELDKFLGKSKVSVVYFGKETDSDFALFKEVAESLESVQFGHSFDSQLKTSEKARRVVLYKDFDEKRNSYTQKPLTKESLVEFIQKNEIPLLLVFNTQAISIIFEQSKAAVILFVGDNEASTKAEGVFTTLSQKTQRSIQFVYSKFNDGTGYYDRLAEYVGIDNKKNPNVMIVQKNEGSEELARYKLEGEITEESVLAFLEQHKAGKLQKFLKSQDIPEPNPEEKVVTVVGKNYQQVVLDGTEDVLVEFYAPWCGHCKSLAPKYENLAKSLAHNKNLIIAKVDSTANDVPGVAIQSFPTLKFFKNGSKNTPIDYNSGRDEDSFVKWLEQNVSHPWVAPVKQEEKQEEKQEKKQADL